MTRKRIKRLLALLKAEAEHGRVLGFELPEGFRETFEKQKTFRGWVNYHVTWDVADDDAWKVVSLRESRVDTWNRALAKRLPVITRSGEVVTSEQWEEMESAGVATLAELEAAKQEG